MPLEGTQISRLAFTIHSLNGFIPFIMKIKKITLRHRIMFEYDPFINNY